MITAHPRITTTLLVGTSVLAVTSFAGLNVFEAAQDLGGGMSRAYNWLKAAGVVGVVSAILFFVIRFNILGLRMPPENGVFMVARRGLLVMRRGTNEAVLHEPGRNRIHVANYRSLVLVHFGDRFVNLGSHEFTIDGVTWKSEFTLKWQIVKDKQRLKWTVTTVSDSNWWDGKFNQLTDAIRESATGKLGEILRTATMDSVTGTPSVDKELAKRLIDAELYHYCSASVELLISPISRTDAQQGKDGSLAIADAISGLGRLGSMLRRLWKRVA